MSNASRIAERVFCKLWVSWLWHAMFKRGKGYMKQSLRNTGKGDDRRADKLLPNRPPKWLRRLQASTIEK